MSSIGSPAPVTRGRLTPAEVRAAINDICAKHNYNPFEELIKLAVATQNVKIGDEVKTINVCDVDQRISIAKELAPYLAPKLKTIEVEQGEGSGGLTINVVSLEDSKPDPREKEIQKAQKDLLPSGKTI
jgi:hypothetical protein